MEMSRRQKEITEAALQLIAEHGIQRLTIRNLSRAIGVTEAAIYRHFSGKAEIIRSLLTGLEEAVFWREDLKGWKALKAFADARIQLVLDNPHWAHVFFSEEIFRDDEEFRVILQDIIVRHKIELERRFLEAMEEGSLRKDISSDVLFCMVFGSIRLLIKQWGMGGHSFDLKKKAEELWKSLELVLRPVGVGR